MAMMSRALWVGSIMPIDRLRTVPVVMMASFVARDKGAELKRIVSV
jgi:hypothetical protein